MALRKQITVGIIGAGYWGPNLVRNFSTLENCRVKYVCDLDERRLSAIARSFPNSTTTRSTQDVFADPDVDAVAIATPVATHFGLVRDALSAGKHVLVEKPMATSSAECEELIALAKKKDLVLAVDHTFLFTGAVRKIKKLVDAGELGTLHYFDSERINLGLLQPDIDVMWDLAPHDISIMLYLFGELPSAVSAVGAKYIQDRFAEMAHITATFPSGVVGHIHVSWLSPVKIRKILLGGSKKMVLYDDIEPSEKVRVYDKGIDVAGKTNESALTPVYRSGDAFIPALEGEEALCREVRHFVACIIGTETPVVSGENGRDVVRVLEACSRSLTEAGRQVAV